MFKLSLLKPILPPPKKILKAIKALKQLARLLIRQRQKKIVIRLVKRVNIEGNSRMRVQTRTCSRRLATQIKRI
jgi:hypothetical protein